MSCHLLSAMMAFEEGTLTLGESLELFAELIRSGLAWPLQGSYGRAAKQLIDAGFIDEEGNLL